MKSVILAAYYFPPLGMGGVQRAVKFASYLPDFGWHPKIITVKPILYYAYDSEMGSHIPSEKIFRTGSLDPNRLAALFFGVEGSSQGAGSSHNRLGNWVNRWLAFPDAKIGWVPFALKKAAHLIRENDIRTVVTTSPPLSSHLVGLRLKKRFGVRWVADLRDYWTSPNIKDFPTEVHRRFHRFLSRAVFRGADAVTAVSGDIRQYVLNSGIVPEEKCFVLTNGFDISDYPQCVSHVGEKFLIVHMGTLNEIKDPRPFLKAIEEVLQREPEFGRFASFVQVGRWFQKEAMLDGLSPEVAKMIDDRGYRSHRESLAALCGGDLLLFPLSGKCPPGVISGSLFEYLPLTNPILGTLPDGEASQLIQRFRRGIVIHPSDIGAIAEAIMDNFNRWKSDKAKYRRDFQRDSIPEEVNEFSRREITGQLAMILDQLL